MAFTVQMDNPILYSTPPVQTEDNNETHHTGYFDAWNVNLNNIYDNSGLLGIDINPKSYKKIDLAKYNKEFERNMNLEYVKHKEREKNNLDKLSYEIEDKSVSRLDDQTIKQLMENTKKTWYDIMDDILDGNLSVGVFVNNDRMFYVGILVVIIVIFIYILITILD